MQTVACIKWGTLFPSDYVNRLYRGVTRHVTRPTRFICFTDDAKGLESGIDAFKREMHALSPDDESGQEPGAGPTRPRR